ncbi:MAG: hypothetical protein FJY76_04090 [Candidatus Aenigmarchaeota archaeon]|nr:hypothetical protein [Candidatus Aenigmarchaeota archaeon]
MVYILGRRFETRPPLIVHGRLHQQPTMNGKHVYRGTERVILIEINGRAPGVEKVCEGRPDYERLGFDAGIVACNLVLHPVSGEHRIQDYDSLFEDGRLHVRGGLINFCGPPDEGYGFSNLYLNGGQCWGPVERLHLRGGLPAHIAGSPCFNYEGFLDTGPLMPEAAVYARSGVE